MFFKSLLFSLLGKPENSTDKIRHSRNTKGNQSRSHHHHSSHVHSRHGKSKGKSIKYSYEKEADYIDYMNKVRMSNNLFLW